MKKCFRVSIDALRIRNKPCTSDNCTILGLLHRGDEVVITGRTETGGYLWGLIGKGRWAAIKRIGSPFSYMKEIQCKDDSTWANGNAIDYSEQKGLRDPNSFFKSKPFLAMIHRVSLGTRVDNYAWHIMAARQFGRVVGGYVVITPYGSVDGATQVYTAANVLSPLAGDIFAIDIEYDIRKDTMLARTEEAALAALNVCRRTGAIPVFYTSVHYYSYLYGDTVPKWLSNFGLWVADYNKLYFGNPRMGAMPRDLLVMHQYAGDVRGKDVGYRELTSVDLSLVTKDFVTRVKEARLQRWASL